MDRPQQTLLKLISINALPGNTLKKDDFIDPFYQATFEKLMNGMTPAEILNECTDNAERQVLSKTFTMEDDIDRADASKIAADCLSGIKIYRLQSRIQQLKEEMKVCENPADKQQVLIEITTLTSKLTKLKSTVKQ